MRKTPACQLILRLIPCPSSPCSSWPLIFPFLVFENVLYRIKFQAIISGILGSKGASDWVVTAKTGAVQEFDDEDEEALEDLQEGIEIEEGASEESKDLESLSPSSSSSADAFVVHTSESVDKLSAYDLPQLGAGLTVRTGREDAESRTSIVKEATLRCSSLPSQMRNLTPHMKRQVSGVSSPLKRGLLSPVASGRRRGGTPLKGEAASLLTPRGREVALKRLERTLSRLPSMQQVRQRVTWASCKRFWTARKFQWPELGLAAYMLGAAAYGVAIGDTRYSLFLAVQGAGFLIAGLDLLGY